MRHREPQLIDGDVVAEWHADGRYTIRRWSARQRTLVPIAGCRGYFTTLAMFKALDGLRGPGETYIRNPSGHLQWVAPDTVHIGQTTARPGTDLAR